MITHDLSTAAHFADRIAVMYLGRIVEEGPAREVVARPAAPVHEGAAVGRAEARPDERSTPQILTGETPNPIDIPPGCRFHPALPGRRGSLHGGSIPSCSGVAGRRLRATARACILVVS